MADTLEYHQLEQLISSMYNPQTPSESIHSITAQLEKIRTSGSATQYIEPLLNSASSECKFFGVKIVAHEASTKPENLHTTISVLISYLLRYIYENVPSVVILTLISLLAELTLRASHISEPWLRLIVNDLVFQRTIDPKSTTSLIPVSEIVTHLNRTMLFFILKYVSDAGRIVRQLYKSLTESGQQAATMPQVFGNFGVTVQDAVALILYTFELTKNSIDTQDEAMTEALLCAGECSYEWVKLSAHLECVSNDWKDLFIRVCDALIDRVAIFDVPALCSNLQTIIPVKNCLNKRQFQSIGELLAKPIVQEAFQSAIDGNENGLEVFRLFIQFAETHILENSRDPNDPVVQWLFVQLHILFKAAAQPHDEGADEVADSILQFWCLLTEELLSIMFDGKRKSPWHETVENNVLIAIRNLPWVIKSCEETWTTWSESERNIFKTFREEVNDFAHDAYTDLGEKVLKEFIDIALAQLADDIEKPDWWLVEAVFYCLGSICDDLFDDPSKDEQFVLLLKPRLFENLASARASQLPSPISQTFIHFVSTLKNLLSRNSTLLHLCLNYLFATLFNPELVTASARSIHLLCGGCQRFLVDQYDVLIQKFVEFLNSGVADDFSKEKVLGGLSAVAQAMDTNELRLQAISGLIDHVEHEVNLGVQLLQECNKHTRSQISDGIKDKDEANYTVKARNHIEHGLRSLSIIASSYHTSDEVYWAVESDSEDESALAINQENTQFWQQGLGQSILVRLFNLMNRALQVCQNNICVVEPINEVLRTGFEVNAPSPFAFPFDALKYMLVNYGSFTNTAEIWLKTLSVFLASRPAPRKVHRDNRAKRDSESDDVFMYVIRLITIVGDSRADQDISSGILTLFSRILIHCEDRLPFFAQQTVMFDSVLDFALQSLTVPELLPRRAAAEFWSKILGLHGQTAHVQSIYNTFIERVSKRLVYAIMEQIMVKCSRSEVSDMGEPIIPLIKRVLNANSLILQTIHSLAPQTKVKPEQIKSYMNSMKTVTKTMKTVRNANMRLWKDCRGFE